MNEIATINTGDSLESVGQFELIQRAAKLFASSSIVPQQFQNKIADCFIAIDMARCLGMSPMQVMQNLYIVHGKPAWSSQFLIATFNCTGRYGAIRYVFQGERGTDEYGCKATAIENATGEVMEGPLVTIGIAKKEGWWSKKDKQGRETSKWQTMPDLMLRYRAAAWFIRSCAPEIAMGLYTVDEVKDIQQNGVVNREIESEYMRAAGSVPPAQEESRKPIDIEPVDAVEAAYSCPKSDGQTVTEAECGLCKEQEGCPEYAGANAA